MDTYTHFTVLNIKCDCLTVNERGEAPKREREKREEPFRLPLLPFVQRRCSVELTPLLSLCALLTESQCSFPLHCLEEKLHFDLLLLFFHTLLTAQKRPRLGGW